MGDGGIRDLLVVLWLALVASIPMLVVAAAGLALVHGAGPGLGAIPLVGYEEHGPP